MLQADHQPNSYKRITQVLDLLTLDQSANNYDRHALAAACLFVAIVQHTFPQQLQGTLNPKANA